MSATVKQNGTGTILQLGSFKATFHDQKSASVIRFFVISILLVVLLSASGWVIPQIVKRLSPDTILSVQATETSHAFIGIDDETRFEVKKNIERIDRLELSDRGQSGTLERLDERTIIIDRKLDKIADYLSQK